MKNRPLLALLLALTLLIPAPALASAPAQTAPADWQPLAVGIDYQKFHLTDPLVDIFVTRLDRSNPNVTIESGISGGTISGGGSTTTAIAGFHDQTINYWGETWGNRSEVVATINGYFFVDQDEPYGLPLSGVVHSGWYAKNYTVGGADAGFTWTMDRNAFIGNCTTKLGSDYEVVFANGTNPNVQAIGIPRIPDSASNLNNVIIYTPQYNSNTLTAGLQVKPVVEVLIEMETPSYINGNPTFEINNYVPASTAVGYVRGYSTTGSMPIPFDHIVVSAWGSPGDTLKGNLVNGEIPIGSQVRVKQFVRACDGFQSDDWVKAYAGLGGDYHFLADGQFFMPSNPDAAVKNARTVIAYNSQYVYFVVVDHYHLNISHGINIPDLTDFLQTQLGATDAVSLDSGTSSTMVVNDQAVNYTECSCMWDLSTRPECGLPGVASRPIPADADPSVPLAACVDPDGDGLHESLAATGMMMVVVEPVQRSQTFSITQSVVVSATTDLRLGPGTNYGSIAALGPGTPGTVVPHMNDLNGVLAKGSFWWKVETAAGTGWVREEALQGGSVPPPPGGDFSMFLPTLSRSALPAAAALYLTGPARAVPLLEAP